MSNGKPIIPTSRLFSWAICFLILGTIPGWLGLDDFPTLRPPWHMIGEISLVIAPLSWWAGIALLFWVYGRWLARPALWLARKICGEPT